MTSIIRNFPKFNIYSSSSLSSTSNFTIKRCIASNSLCKSQETSSSSSASSSSSSSSPSQEQEQPQQLDDNLQDLIDSEQFQQPQIVPVKYPYYVSRAGAYSDSLPVYTDVRHGGQSVFTILRRIQGNVEALRNDLITSLPSLLAPEPISSRIPKPRAGRTLEPAYPTRSQPIKSSKVGAVGKIVIRGDRRRELREWLEERGF